MSSLEPSELAPGLLVGEGVQFGEGVELGGNAVIHALTRIGNFCVIGDAAVIGKAPMLGPHSTASALQQMTLLQSAIFDTGEMATAIAAWQEKRNAEFDPLTPTAKV